MINKLSRIKSLSIKTTHRCSSSKGTCNFEEVIILNILLVIKHHWPLSQITHTWPSDMISFIIKMFAIIWVFYISMINQVSMVILAKFHCLCQFVNGLCSVYIVQCQFIPAANSRNAFLALLFAVWTTHGACCHNIRHSERFHPEFLTILPCHGRACARHYVQHLGRGCPAWGEGAFEVVGKDCCPGWSRQQDQQLPVCSPDALNKPRLLPLMVGNKIPVADIRLSNFWLPLEIINYIFAPVLSLDHVAYLHTIIEDHHRTFAELYPSCSITPKMHYVIHYP